mmetsp:Transcript_11586/g.23330  ORF Transcript_11586/g.23330 Transcript_11586/m.23330 type:complete len:427 (-) Transcript_11586:237-1517(-)|eukprot:CAMPEP_0167826728 /NCGR_PEP_ID=MMETSP0112_2-20121227/10220_1 /TAXON_ID=91324 /ORGANISM="Lotharella globosa, Strain CCCM811" /LENGTH=426 /DNA_ID=CAMNT_0007729253 /DNA_START=77 /DNA_END=1357 /DNA_ORIENTATION=+
MHKAVAADEIIIDERTQGHVKSAEVVHKGNGVRSTYSSSNNKAPATVVSEIIEARAQRRGEVSMGVWNPLGSQYTCNGNPDTDLVELQTDDRKCKKRQVHKQEYSKASQHFIKLKTNLRKTDLQLQNWNKAPKTEPVKKKPVKKEELSSPKSTAPREKTTIEKIKDLFDKPPPKKKVVIRKKVEYDFAQETDPDTLVARWYEAFAQQRKKKERELLDALIAREEDKHSVFSSKILRNNATYIVGAVDRRTRKKSRSSRKSTRASIDNPDYTMSTGKAFVRKRLPSINEGDTCIYESPVGLRELVQIEKIEETEFKIKGGEELEYNCISLETGLPRKAYRRYLRKYYDKLQCKQTVKKKASELSLWERSKLMKLRSMAIEAPATHFANRVRRAELRGSKVQTSAIVAGSEASRFSPMQQLAAQRALS